MSKTKYRFNDDDLKELLAECEAQLDLLGISHQSVDVIKFGRLQKAMARCTQFIERDENEVIEIVIGKMYARNNVDFTKADLKNLVMHELIHTIPSEKRIDWPFLKRNDLYHTLGHGEKWNEIAHKIEDAYPEYSFFDNKGHDDAMFPLVPVKYIYKCPRCGKIERFRKTEPMTDLVCPMCGSPVSTEKAELADKADLTPGPARSETATFNVAKN